MTQFRKANDIGPDQTSQTTKQHNVQPEDSSSQPVYRIDPKGPNNSLNCYEQSADDQSEECFLNISSMSAATAKTLSSSNLPSSGVLRASLTRAMSLLLLPTEWRDIPINSISGKSKGTDHRSFGGDYVAFFTDILKLFNSFCCWIFKKNLIKQ